MPDATRGNGASAVKVMYVRVGHTMKLRRLTWYDPCEPSALDAMLRAACGVAPSQQYLLLDQTMCAVAVSSSLPSGETYELSIVGPAPGKEHKKKAIVVIDPIST